MKTIKVNNLEKDTLYNLWENEEIEINFEDIDDDNIKRNIKINLNWDNSKARVYWKIYSRKNSKKEYQININIHWENQQWTLDIRWIAEWSSIISVDWSWLLSKNSKNANINIEEKIMLFSNNARWKAIPTLKVETNNIANASHSAIITPIDADILFYIWTRWLSENSWKKLIKKWFFKK